jgi:hypothetical protein
MKKHNRAPLVWTNSWKRSHLQTDGWLKKLTGGRQGTLVGTWIEITFFERSIAATRPDEC